MKKILYIFTLLILFLTSCRENTTSEKRKVRVDTLYVKDTIYIKENPEPLTYKETFHFVDSVDLNNDYDLWAKVIYTADGQNECICQEISNRFAEIYEGNLLYYVSSYDDNLIYDNKIIKNREAVFVGTYSYYDDNWKKVTIPMYSSKEAWFLK